jgi:hypothetical protein
MKLTHRIALMLGTAILAFTALVVRADLRKTPTPIPIRTS